MSTTTGTFTRWRADWHRILDARPGVDYFMIRSVVFLLVGIGAVMVMSSTMTWSVLEGATVWNQALRQFMMIAAGLIAFLIALRTRPETIRRLTPWLLLVSLVLLVAVLIPGIGTGRLEVGSQSWIVLGPLRFQPSELAKVAIAVWGASYLADKRHTTTNIRSPFVIYTAVAAVMGVLIAAQGDMGMAVNFGIVVMFTLFFAGVDFRLIIAAGLAALGLLIALFLGGGFRSQRFHVYFDALFGRFDDTRGTAFQSYQGFLSLADGSVAGVGVGQSRAKWFYLPEAKNDFIFAIIGEELGLWGGAMVIALFAALGYFGLRAALRAQNQFQALLAAALTAGVVSQAFINIGYVVGLLPVTGIQLPMISAGGTSTIITLGSMGLLASVARHEPEAVSAMASYGRPLFDRMFLLPEPAVRRPSVRRGAGERFGEPVTGSVKRRNRPHHDRRR
ncbi:MAG: putative peptidoglycan glycosyltransferase FtsW [Corynebacterium sp.]|uniref:FtsW/RodA/SpoVE family cell cycle protein n=1 Tax=Corynebacterium sp. TaxID=1720 RepID=UPI0026DFA07C|nr:putative peptidoglycan glycosyltransferase FtsW [Corynebacterium sp.]MDO5668824.1 putative peptidoglycan glycosyltransferase FtsW [Corynebacterium sp.]